MKSKRADVNQTKDMKEGLRIADDIRGKLKARFYSDSTKLVRENRGRIPEPLELRCLIADFERVSEKYIKDIEIRGSLIDMGR